MDRREEFTAWIISEARNSYKFWHSSKEVRPDLRQPMFDKTLTEDMYRLYADVINKDTGLLVA